MVSNGSADDSSDEDYADKSEAAGSKRGRRPRPRKRVRWVKDTKDNGVEAPSTHSLDISCQAAAATSPDSMHESEEIPIHGYFTLCFLYFLFLPYFFIVGNIYLFDIL